MRPRIEVSTEADKAPKKSAKERRAELDRQIAEFMQSGGVIKSIDRGVTGLHKTEQSLMVRRTIIRNRALAFKK